MYCRGCGNLGEGVCGLVQVVYLGMEGVVMGRTGHARRMAVDVLGVAVTLAWGGVELLFLVVMVKEWCRKIARRQCHWWCSHRSGWEGWGVS